MSLMSTPRLTGAVAPVGPGARARDGRRRWAAGRRARGRARTRHRAGHAGAARPRPRPAPPGDGRIQSAVSAVSWRAASRPRASSGRRLRSAAHARRARRRARRGRRLQPAAAHPAAARAREADRRRLRADGPDGVFVQFTYGLALAHPARGLRRPLRRATRPADLGQSAAGARLDLQARGGPTREPRRRRGGRA